MIQMTNSRRGSSAVAPFRRVSTSGPSNPNSWGTSYNRRFYTLEIVQQPIRARTCGFGDKDRRPIAPAVVAKLIVRNEDNSLVDEDDIDISFFIATADLWDSEGQREMNLVLHPTSSDRYIPTHQPTKRRRGGTDNAPSPGEPPNTGPPLPLIPADNPPYPPPPPGDLAHSGLTALVPDPPSPRFTASLFSLPPDRSPVAPQPITLQPIQPYNLPDTMPWTYGPVVPPPPTYSPVPSISRTAVAAASSSSASLQPWHSEMSSPIEPHSYRNWATASNMPYGQIELEPVPSQVSSASTPVDNSFRRLASPLRYVDLPPAREELALPPISRKTDGKSSSRDAAPSSTSTASGSYESPVYASASYGQLAPRQAPFSQKSGPYPETMSASTIPPLPRHAYTRTLVGLLTANACRMQDEHRKSGIFFLFHDLSVRTEGPFRLRIRLMNIGVGIPGSDNDVREAHETHADVSPILSQIFTDKFEVYTAKRFPGVPPTTALSIALANQGQKLPLRNRHGSKRSRRRGDGGESEDDYSDGYQ